MSQTRLSVLATMKRTEPGRAAGRSGAYVLAGASGRRRGVTAHEKVVSAVDEIKTSRGKEKWGAGVGQCRYSMACAEMWGPAPDRPGTAISLCVSHVTMS